MTIKVSLIVIIEKYDEKAFLQCLDSLINQSLKEIEIICVSEFHIDNANEISKIDERIHFIQGESNNLKSIGLSYAHGEYVSFINSNDWVNLEFSKCLYDKAINDNLDILIFKIMEYNYNYFQENYYYNFFNFEEKYLYHSFTHEDISEILFSIPQDIYNKFYRKDFLNKIFPLFYDINIFEDSIFFFKVFLNAKKIALFDEHIYIKRISFNDKFNSENILIELINMFEIVFYIFKELNFFNMYKKRLFNYKIDLIRFWYILANEDVQKKSIDYICSDFISMGELEILKNSPFFLNEQNLFFYNNLIKHPSWGELNLIYENSKLKSTNDKITLENQNDKQAISIFKENYDALSIELNEILIEKNEDDVKLKNLICKQNNLINKFYEKIKFQ